MNGPTNVKWHPPATAIAVGRPPTTRSGAPSQWGATGRTIRPVEVGWRGVRWLVAWDRDELTLWVMTPLEEEVAQDCHCLDLVALAKVFREGKDPPRASSTDITPEQVSAQGRIAQGRGSKASHLANLTASAKLAIATGASLKEVRLAVFAAMGLDDDVAS